ncbi:MAG: hypothetical protein K6F53_04895 [Lachnospiraceae bacterium]|nr:hypothetical protein [Lachnospiraceae bacterium]
MAHLYDETYGRFADKYAVRQYVADCGLDSLLVPVYEIWEDPSEIDFSGLPAAFVLKATHGAGDRFREFVYDKDTADIDKIKEKFSKVFKYNYALKRGEYHYAGIKPRIICEKMLMQPGHPFLNDFKIVCSYGKAKAVLVCSERNKGRDYYSCDWQYLEYVKPEYRSDHQHQKPAQLDEMIRVAEILSRPFPLARIDLYCVEDRIYMGEITLTPYGGSHNYLTDYGQSELGKMISLPSKAAARRYLEK